MEIIYFMCRLGFDGQIQNNEIVLKCEQERNWPSSEYIRIIKWQVVY